VKSSAASGLIVGLVVATAGMTWSTVTVAGAAVVVLLSEIRKFNARDH
jgi:hypothetical protein